MLAELLLSQFDHEMATTRAVLSRVPEASAPISHAISGEETKAVAKAINVENALAVSPNNPK